MLVILPRIKYIVICLHLKKEGREPLQQLQISINQGKLVIYIFVTFIKCTIICEYSDNCQSKTRSHVVYINKE